MRGFCRPYLFFISASFGFSGGLRFAIVAQSDARPTVDQDVGVRPRRVGNIILWRLIMKYFLWSFSFSPADSRSVAVGFWRKNVNKNFVNRLDDYPCQGKVG